MTAVTDVMVADMRVPESREVLERAVALLRDRSWMVDTERLPDWVSMRSDRWEDTELSLTRFESFQVDEFEDPQLAKVIKSVRARVGTEGVIVLEFDRKDRP
ncbi:hypothetical protein ACQP1K_08760 [Sphaerimonospora sp. CA-214678]|uniref:hypothetical protein n=1 Tax=Sphaerimonospora sp. CA-214678 TaxID=3240029 RepID=UPI003D8E7ECE